MNKVLLVGFLLAIATQSLGQGIVVQNSNPTSSIANRGSYIADSIFRIGTRDTVKPSWWNPAWSFNGALQIGLDGKPYYYFGGYWRGVGSGASVTSITQGYGMALSPSPIVSTGSVSVDTTAISTKANVNSLLSAKVPYVGATSNVNLGEFQATVGQVTLDQTPTQAAGVGVLRWNDSDGTADLGLKGGNVTLQIGQEEVVRVVNKTGANLLESQYHAVYVSGAQGQRLKVGNALALADSSSAATIGLVTENINLNQEGFITTNGLVRDINTTGSLQGETWNDGDLLYLSGTTAGQITNVKPIAPTHTVIIGYVVYAHANNGKIFVKVDNGYELDELHNVRIVSAANNQGLFYDSVAKLWENKSISTVLGYTPANNATVVKYADTSSMLASYLRKVDTASLSTRINTKLNSADTASLSTRIEARVKYTDTATMLGGYLRKVDTASLSNRITAAGNDWKLTGNSGTSSSTNFIGTTDNVDLVFRRSNVVSGWLGTNNNTSFGVSSMPRTTTSGGSTAYGNSALAALTSGNNNSGFGYRSLWSCTTGTDNVAFGGGALQTLTTGQYNTAIGQAALLTSNGNRNNALGFRTLFLNTTGNQNCAFGYQTGYTNTTGTNNSAFGDAALEFNSVGSNNVAFGGGALNRTTGSNNIGIGSSSAFFSTTGSNNTSVGNNSNLNLGTGENNTALGALSSTSSSAGSNNIAVGYNASASGSGLKNLTVAYSGSVPLSTGSNQMNIGNVLWGVDCSGTGSTAAGRLGVGTNAPNASALLDLTSTTQGLLLPRMTTAQINAIGSPAAGLTVYNTDLLLICFYNGTAWQKVTATAM